MAKATDKIIELNVLIGFQGDHYVARSVDLEIVAQSKSRDQLPLVFLATYVSTYRAYAKRGLDMLKAHPKAPKEIREIFNGNSLPTEFPQEHFDHTIVKPNARVIVGLFAMKYGI